jgi:hypothetical protein
MNQHVANLTLQGSGASVEPAEKLWPHQIAGTLTARHLYIPNAYLTILDSASYHNWPDARTGRFVQVCSICKLKTASN